MHGLACTETITLGPDETMAPKALKVELLAPDAAATHVAPWRRLAADCLEPNVFLEPGFALPAARHLAKGRAPRFLFVWEEDDAGPRKLVGVCPLAAASAFDRILPTWIWTHEQAPLGVPLLDPIRGEEALAAIFSFCRTHLPQVAGLIFPLLPQEGRVAQLLVASAAAEGRSQKFFDMHPRAVLVPGMEPQRYLERSVGSARRRKLNKARKSLQAIGSLELRIIRHPQDIRATTEEFFVLEAKGWKGRRGTAFLKSPERAGFARDVALQLGAEDKYFAVSLDLNKKPIAMALILESGGRAFWWKITYDEDFASFSPGVLLAFDMTRHLLDDPRITLTDSCTGSETPMIDHIWSERMPIADVLVAVSPDRPRRFELAAHGEELRRTLRRRLKSIVLRLRDWKEQRPR